MRKNLSLFLAVVMVVSLFAGIGTANAAEESWLWPVKDYYSISSDYGQRTYQINGKTVTDFHNGIDIQNCNGKPIRAAKSGGAHFYTTNEKGLDSSLGNHVVINHYDGTFSLYAHASKLADKGSKQVKQGDIIAYVGDTGNANGPHLHFEIRKKANYNSKTDFAGGFWGYAVEKPTPTDKTKGHGITAADGKSYIYVVCEHKEYDDKGNCTVCGAAYPLKLTAEVSELLTRNRDSKLSTVPVRARPFSGLAVTADIPNGFVFYAKEKALNGKFTDGVEHLWYKGDIFDPGTKKLLSNVWIYSGNVIFACPSHADHSFVSGYCSKCGTRQPATPDSTTSSPAVAEGEYLLRSGSVYLNATKDADGGNVNAVTSKIAAAQKWTVKKSGSAYRITSQFGAGKRVLNVYTEGKSAAGTNVTLWSVTGDKTQLWLFEQKGGGYLLHPADNAGVALTVQSNNDVKLGANAGGANQVWYLERPPAVTAVPSPAPSPTAAPTVTPTPASTATPRPTTSPTPSGNMQLQAMLVGNDKQAIGIQFSWEPNENPLSYRLYRSEKKGKEGVSVSDFPIQGGEYIDVNIDPYTEYYYTVRPVLAEASQDPKTGKLTGEKLGEASSEVSIKTPEIRTNIEQRRSFILMQIGKGTMLVNETILEIDPGRDTVPAVVSGRTLVPIRTIIEAMGGTVDWEETTRKITLEVNEHTVEMSLDRYTFYVDGEMDMLDVPPAAINGRTMLPVRFVAENVGCEIEWIGSTQQIVIVFYQ